jgi:hypothetical protein
MSNYGIKYIIVTTPLRRARQDDQNGHIICLFRSSDAKYVKWTNIQRIMTSAPRRTDQYMRATWQADCHPAEPRRRARAREAACGRHVGRRGWLPLRRRRARVRGRGSSARMRGALRLATGGSVDRLAQFAREFSIFYSGSGV